MRVRRSRPASLAPYLNPAKELAAFEESGVTSTPMLHAMGGLSRDLVR
jgi:hypothetical protein